MKQFLRKFVLKFLTQMAKRRLRKFRGKIIAVTGSIGKTSTKDAIYTILNSQFKVKRSQKSMNSEFGLLLTILDIPSGYSSAVKWSWYLTKGFIHSFSRDLSEVLLLELGVDKPGDMDFLTSIVKPDIAILTNINPVHLDEQGFKNLEEIFAEKSKLAEALKPGGKLLLCGDDPILAPFAEKFAKEEKEKAREARAKKKDYQKREVISFSRQEDGSDFKASLVDFSAEGTSFLVEHKETKYQFKVPAIGEFVAYSMLPAIICGTLFEMSIEQCIIAGERFTLPPGRMSLIEGENEIEMLDSTYNSSPVALKEALNILEILGKGKRKVAVLGNMNDLGENSEALHRIIGEILPAKVDFLITVGKDAKEFGTAAIEKGLEEAKIEFCNSTPEAIEFYKKNKKKGDLVLVKGSQNRIRLERFVKEFMLHPELAKELLVRQNSSWQKIA